MTETSAVGAIAGDAINLSNLCWQELRYREFKGPSVVVAQGINEGTRKCHSVENLN